MGSRVNSVGVIKAPTEPCNITLHPYVSDGLGGGVVSTVADGLGEGVAFSAAHGLGEGGAVAAANGLGEDVADAVVAGAHREIIGHLAMIRCHGGDEVVKQRVLMKIRHRGIG